MRVPNGPIKAIGVCLHGFGDEASNFLSVADEVDLQEVLWVSLDGPFSLDPRMGLADGRMWFDLFSDPWTAIDEARNKIMSSIQALVDASELSLARVFLLGFSQGGFMALHTGLSLPVPPAAIVSLSGFLMGAHRLAPSTDVTQSTPVFIGHGLQDQVVLPLWYYETLDLLRERGYGKIQNRAYPVGHSLHPQEVRDVREFLRGII